MAPTIKRIIAAAGTTALIAGAVIVGAPSAHADGGYYGTWTLAAIKADGQKVKCEGSEGLCPGGQTLVLKTNYRYATSAYLARILIFTDKGGGKGSFATPVFPGTQQQVLVLEDDAGGIVPLGSAWQMVLKDKRSGSPTKLVLSLQTGFGEYTLVLRRDAQ